MSFREPAVLLGLALLPLAAAAYAVMQRRRRADAARFAHMTALLHGAWRDRWTALRGLARP